MKRAFDVLAAGAALTALSPLMVIIGLAVRATSSGPVLFKQERVGVAGEPFVLLKFRSMTVGGSGALITSSGDSRITAVGRVLRKYKLDELPQLINVLRGEMSIVGPRPEVEHYVRDFESDFETVLRVRPGLTDPASLAFRNEEELLAAAADSDLLYREQILPEKLRLSGAYANSASMRSDFKIIAATALATVCPSRAPQA